MTITILEKTLTLWDIVFILFAATLITIIIWEIIPDCFKKYWGYQRQLRKDKRKGKRKRYSFTWRIR